MTDGSKAVNIQHQRMWLMPQKAMFWQKRKTLLVADLHIGKSAHFRRHGLPVPGRVNHSNLANLSHLVEKTEAEHLIILGDLFHSEINREWNDFVEWRKERRQLEVSLVVGNHDILSREKYHTGIINIFKKMSLAPFLFTHDITTKEEAAETENYILSGHVHPAVKLQNRGRQQMKFPCFFFGECYGILPAFGQFTGTHVITPGENDQAYIIVDGHILNPHRF